MFRAPSADANSAQWRPSPDAASTSEMGRFETEWLTSEENFGALVDLPGAWIDRVHACRPPKLIILDMDSPESPTYGNQEASAYNGHFGCTCYRATVSATTRCVFSRTSWRTTWATSSRPWRYPMRSSIGR